MKYYSYFILIAFVFVGTTLNAVFWFSQLGMTMAVIAAMIDLSKPVMSRHAVDGINSRDFVVAATLSVFIVAAVVISFISTLGFNQSRTNNNVEQYDRQQIKFDEYISSKTRLTESLKKITVADSVSDLESRIEKNLGVLNSNMIRRTNGCTDVTKPSSKRSCTAVVDARNLLVLAQRRDALLKRLRGLEPVQKPKSPYITLSQTVSELLGVGAHTVELSMYILIAVVIEIGSLMSFVLIQKTSGVTNEHKRPKPGRLPKVENHNQLEKMLKNRGGYHGTQKNLAESIGVSEPTLSRWLRVINAKREGGIISL